MIFGRTSPSALLLATLLAIPISLPSQSGPSPDTFDTSSGPVEITPIMHASVLLRAGGKTIYIDPAQGSFDGRPAADLILITDIHGDDMSPDNVKKLSRAGTVVWGPKAVADKMHVDNVISNGETKKWENWIIEAVPAYNLKRGPAAGQLYHDKGRGNGYVLTYGGKRFYFSGDTEAIPEMEALRNIDVAFVCMNLPYTMTPEEAAAAVRKMHPAVVYPYHYRGSDLHAFSSALEGSGIEVRLREWYPKT
jgi:L-ascorbate metabolism protein UlaG (beta-lactamase superfamily)